MDDLKHLFGPFEAARRVSLGALEVSRGKLMGSLCQELQTKLREVAEQAMGWARVSCNGSTPVTSKYPAFFEGIMSTLY